MYFPSEEELSLVHNDPTYKALQRIEKQLFKKSEKLVGERGATEVFMARGKIFEAGMWLSIAILAENDLR